MSQQAEVHIQQLISKKKLQDQQMAALSAKGTELTDVFGTVAAGVTSESEIEAKVREVQLRAQQEKIADRQKFIAERELMEHEMNDLKRRSHACMGCPCYVAHGSM